jgi:hypothetical protein
MPEMDSTGQRAPIRVSLTSLRLKELIIGQVLRNTRACEQNPKSWKIQNKYFYLQYSNETFYTKALEYKEYFTHIAFQKMTNTLEDIQLFLDMKHRMFGQAVSINIWFSVCVMFWRHLTPRSKGYFVRISMVAFVLKGVKYSPRYLL